MVIAYVCIDRLTFRRGQLLRKRNFTIVPYSSSHDLHQAAVARSPRSADGPDFHIITNMSDRKVKQMMIMVMVTIYDGDDDDAAHCCARRNCSLLR